MKETIRTIIVCTCLLPFTVWAETNNEKTDNNYEKLSSNLDLFNHLFKELDMYYVDSIDSKKVIGNGVDYMLSQLDPYTTYIPEEEKEDFNFMITGEYAGVGASIGIIDSFVCFTEIYEGSPAQKAGIQAGERIIEIAGEKVETKKLNVNKVSEKLRGEKGETISMVLQNPLTGSKRKLNVVRERITMPTIEYADTICKNIGYIRFNSFTENSAEYFKKAFIDLKENKKISSLVIDLRNNPGGLLDQAVEIVNYFIENQSTIAYTKSKLKQLDEVYKAAKKPIDDKIPLVVLINANSASAAEIFSGTMQDLDRAVIVGERSYGKGLVQTSRPLPFGGTLKVTISKYYIPSGRCIQAINYAERDDYGNVKRIPDSLTTAFKTRNGRIVRDGSGITPDVEIKSKNFSTIAHHLYSNNLIFNYVTEYVAKHPKIDQPKDFVFTDYEEFKSYVQSKKVDYKLTTEKAISYLKELAESEGYLEHSKAEFEALEKKLSHNLEQDLTLFKDEISLLISTEIMRRTYYQKGAIIETIKDDQQIDEAISILNDTNRYQQLLQPQKEESKK